MDQQASYDMVPASTTTGSTWGVLSTTSIAYTPPRWLPAIPASPDYVEGTWQPVPVGTGTVNGVSTPLYEWQLVGRVGDPGLPAREDRITSNFYGFIPSTSAGVAPEYLTLARQTTLPCLTDADDRGNCGPRRSLYPPARRRSTACNSRITRRMPMCSPSSAAPG